MPRIPNAESATAAPPPNSDEEREAEKHWDISVPFQESILEKGNRTVHWKMGFIQELQTVIIFVAILKAFLNNHFSKERDRRDDLF